jgi:hypothetical protein
LAGGQQFHMGATNIYDQDFHFHVRRNPYSGFVEWLKVSGEPAVLASLIECPDWAMMQISPSTAPLLIYPSRDVSTS